jgi:hypothetical protein
MKKESVLELKQEVLKSVMVSGGGRAGAATQSLVNPRVESRLAVGYSEKSKGDFQLELRVQRKQGAAYQRALSFKEQAKQEANIEEIPQIEIPTKTAVFEAGDKPRLVAYSRPLHIGLSVGHNDGGAGTLGAFVADGDGNECILSNNHVLAPTKEADAKDSIYQPGRPDQSPLRIQHLIARLSDATVLAKDIRNEADSAIAILVSGMNHESNKIPTGYSYPMEGEMITEPNDEASMLELLNKDEIVCKIGRTTGYTEGRISAVALDNVPVKTAMGNMLFDNVIEINWESQRKPFSLPGDSGSLVFTRSGRIAVGLHFAGGRRKRDGKLVGVSYSCNIMTVLKAHNASLLD